LYVVWVYQGPLLLRIMYPFLRQKNRCVKTKITGTFGVEAVYTEVSELIDDLCQATSETDPFTTLKSDPPQFIFLLTFSKRSSVFPLKHLLKT